MLYYAIFAAVLLGSIMLGAWPIVRHGDETANNFALITMRPPEFYQSDASLYSAVFAQELAEYTARWIGALILGAGPAYALIDKPYGWGACALAVIVATAWTALATRQVELIGHATEVVQAGRCGVDREAYLAQECRSMAKGYGDAFTGMTLDQLAGRVRSRFGIARVLLAVLHVPVARAVRRDLAYVAF